MTIKTLEGISSQEILEVFNHSFSDYFIPFKLTHEQLVDKMKADRTDLSLSVGAFENDKLVAFILHGFDTINNEKIVYNGGTGVIPENRGAGLTKQMYSFILPLLKKKGIHKLLLEVISNNVQAIKSYKKSGFKVKRTLTCYKGTIKITLTSALLNGSENAVSVINVDKNSKELNDFFEHLGLKNTLDQLEMELKLNTKT